MGERLTLPHLIFLNDGWGTGSMFHFSMTFPYLNNLDKKGIPPQQHSVENIIGVLRYLVHL